ncbi:MAG: DUF6798 domain-containing protein [Planctomycetota bacterium]
MRRVPLQTVAVIAFGVFVSYAVRGYQFGLSNHQVYLLDALRINDPALLQNDWWTANTLQYHWLFSYFAAAVMRLGIEVPAFFIAHLATVVLLHIAWWRIVRLYRGGVATYIVSVLLYHALLGGFGLGFYAFLQDSAFLPSNVAAVALLWGVSYWLIRRDVAAGLCVGFAGVWHLNYAVVGVGAWGIYLVWRLGFARGDWRPLAWATLAAWGPCLLNIIPALIGKAQTDDLRIPLDEYVDLYVKLRHPHHYHPVSWPVVMWITFLAPIPLAWRAWKIVPRTIAWRRGSALVYATLAVLLIALLGAGIFWTSGTLIQMSLWRFSVFPKLILCVAASVWLVAALNRGRDSSSRTTAWDRRGAWFIAGGVPAIGLVSLFTGIVPEDHVLTGWTVLACIAAGLPIALGRWWFALPGLALMVATLGWNGTAEKPGDPALREVAAWAQTNTPADAVFVVPPGNTAFRLDARRAAVVTFKHVPQLSGEMRTWRNALQDVLAIDDLTTVPGTLPEKLSWMDQRYRTRPLHELRGVATDYDADFVVAPPTDGESAAFVSGDRRWAVYVVETDASSDPN